MTSRRTGEEAEVLGEDELRQERDLDKARLRPLFRVPEAEAELVPTPPLRVTERTEALFIQMSIGNRNFSPR